VGLGLARAVALTQVIEDQLYGAKSTDLVAFVTVPVLLIVVALLASYIPARRAASIDPNNALRHE